MDKTGTVEKLYKNYRDHVYNYIARMCDSSELALDITQEVFIKLLSDKNVTSIKHVKAYLFTIARNTLYDTWKKKSELPMSDEIHNQYANQSDSNVTNIDSVKQSSDKLNMSQAMARLKPAYREVLLLHYVEDLSYPEIVSVTGNNLASVKVNLHRARSAFDKLFTVQMYSKVAPSRKQCDTLGTMLEPFSDRDIPDQDMKAIEKHFSKCSICKDDADDLKQRRELFATLPLLIAPAFWEDMIGAAHASTVATGSTTATTTVTTGLSLTKVASIIAISASVITGSYFLLKDKPIEAEPETLITSDTAEPLPPPVTEEIPQDATLADTTIPESASIVEDTPEYVTTEPASTESINEQPTDTSEPPTTPAETTELASAEPAATTSDDTPSWWVYENEPFSGDYTSKNGFDSTSSEFKLSQYGARHEGNLGPAQEYFIFIANFKQKKGWLIDPARKIYVDMQIDENGKSGLLPNFEEHMDNLLGRKPCEHFQQARLIENTNLSGRNVEKWRCIYASTYQSTTQWYDPELKLIIAEQNDSIGYQVISNIKKQSWPESDFEIPGEYSEVSANEFFATNIF